MGTHRAGGRWPGISKGPKIALAVIVVLALAVFGWFQLRHQTSKEGSRASAECVEGPATLAVTTDPDVADTVRKIADRYNATKPVVRDHCIHVDVTDKPSLDIAHALGAPTWDAKALGPRPALWIPDSSRAVRQAEAPGLVDGDPKPVASSPVVLAVPAPLKQALDKAKTGWRDLPQLQQGTLDGIGLAGWGGLRLTLPSDDATLAAVEAVAAATSGAQPLSDDAARSGSVTAAVSALTSGAPKTDSARAALDAIRGPQPEKANIHAVAVTQQQLQSAGAGVEGYRPGGAGPVADHPATVLAGNWIDQTQSSAAGLFSDFLRRPEQQKTFSGAGFQTPAQPAGAIASKAAYAQLNAMLTPPAMNSTVLLDVSASMATPDGPRTRLADVVSALKAQLATSDAASAAGLWTFAWHLDGDNRFKTNTPTAPLTSSQRDALDNALGAVQPDPSATTDGAYPALEAAYKAAVGSFAPGHTNSVLLITDGPNDSSSVTGADLLDAIGSTMDSAKPVRVDVIVIGSGSDSSTLPSLADKTGGSFVKVPSAAGPEMNAALARTLG